MNLRGTNTKFFLLYRCMQSSDECLAEPCILCGIASTALSTQYILMMWADVSSQWFKGDGAALLLHRCLLSCVFFLNRVFLQTCDRRLVLPGQPFSHLFSLDTYGRCMADASRNLVGIAL